MPKIVIIGYSGSGKSTLANALKEHYHIPVLHLDRVHFNSDWTERDKEVSKTILNKFMDDNTSYVIEGNYFSWGVRRFKEADLVIELDYNRFFCFKEALKRYLKNRGKVSYSNGCVEKFDLEFAKWILYKGRTKKKKLTKQKALEQISGTYLRFTSRKKLHTYLNQKEIEQIA